MPSDLAGSIFPDRLFGIGANVLSLFGSYWIARSGLRQPPGLTRWLATAIVFWTAVTLGLETLSLTGSIAPLPILISSALLAAVGRLISWRDITTREPVAQPPALPPSWDARMPLGIVLATALVLFLRSLLMGVKVVSDGPIYHLYFAARWWKAGRLILVAAPFGENAATYFPANGDLWFTWLMASWSGDQFAKVGQVPFLVLAGLAAGGCARLLGAGRSASVVAVCWFVSSTPLVLFSFEPNVDTIFVAGYMLSAYFLLRFVHHDGGTPALALAGLSAGLALGTKSVALVFVPLLSLLAVIAVLGRDSSRRTRGRQIAVYFMTTLLTSAFWFARNFWLTGNPLYPLDVRVFGHSVLSGWYGPDAMRFSPYYRPLSDWRSLGDILLSVLDPRLVPVWLFAIVAGVILPRSLPRDQRRSAALFAVMAVLNIALYWLFIPYRTQQRFMLQALGIAVLPLALTFERLPWLRLIASVLVCLHLLTPENWPLSGGDESIPWDLTRVIPNAVGAPMSLLPRIELALRATASGNNAVTAVAALASMIALLIAGIAMVWAFTRGPAIGRSRIRRRMTALLSVLAFVGVGVFDSWLVGVDFGRSFYPPFADFYRGWLELESRSGLAGSRVAYAGTNIPYYLQAAGLRNDVRYINVDGHRDWLLHDYHRSARARGEGLWPNSRPGWDRAAPEYQAWLDNLAAERIQLLVVTRVNPDEGPHNVADSENFPIERVWADAHPDRFEPLYGARERDPWFRLYRVRPDAKAHPDADYQPSSSR